MCGVTFAAPPWTEDIQRTENFDCQIEYGGNYYWRIEQPRTENFHVVNSTGYPLSASNIKCSLHTYGIDGTHYFVNNSILSDQRGDFEVIIPANNISKFYATLIIQCNASGYGCLVSHPVYGYAGTTPPETGDASFTMPISLVYVFITLLIILGMFFAPQWLKYLLVIPLNLMIMALLRLSGIFVEMFYPNQEKLIEVLTRFYSFSAVLIYPVVAICMVYATYLGIIGIMTSRKKKQEEKERWGMD